MSERYMVIDTACTDQTPGPWGHGAGVVARCRTEKRAKEVALARLGRGDLDVVVLDTVRDLLVFPVD